MYFKASAVKVVLASPPTGHRASITSKKSAKDKVLGLVQGCEGHSNIHAKSSMSAEKSNHMTETMPVMDVGGLGDSESSYKEEALAAAGGVEGGVGKHNHMAETMSVMGVGGLGNSESSNKEEAVAAQAEGGGVGKHNHMAETMAVMGAGGFGDSKSSDKEEALAAEAQVEGGGVGERNYMTETMPVVGAGGFGDSEPSNKEEALAAEVEGGVGGGVGERNYMTETMALVGLAFDIGDAGLLGRSMSFSNKKVVDNSGVKNVSWLDLKHSMGMNGTMISAYSNRPVVPIAMPPKDCSDMTKTEHVTLNGVIANAVHDSFGAGLHINSNLPRKEMENTVDGGRDLNMNYSNHMVGKSSIGLTAMAVLGSENVCTKLVNSSIRLKKKKKLAPGPWKRLFNVFLLCQFFSFIYASASVDQQTGKLGFSLDKDIRKLRGIDNSENSVGVIESVKKFILSLSNGLEPIQHHYKEGEFEEAGKSLKAIVGNMDSVAQSLKDTKHVQVTEKYLPELFAKENDFSSDNGIISLKDIPNSMLGEQIHSEVFNQIVDFSKKLSNTLEDIDLPLLDDVSSKKKTSHVNSNFRHHKSKPNTKNKQQSAFDEFNSGNFMKIPTAQSIRKQVKVKGRGISLPKISTFVSVRDYNTVMSKHQLREEKMDVCSSECEVSNITCGCSKLFDCVQKLNEYDLAVLSAGGFIDDTAGSDNYGKFTVQTDELNLFNWDQDISKALQDVKDLVEESNPGDKEQCIAVLEKFHTACDPNSESCSKSNPHTFQATIDQVCEAVNTKVKLNFEAIGDEFDGFVDEEYEPKSNQLSYTTCLEFLTGFSNLYDLRNETEYTLPNPMLQMNIPEFVHVLEFNEEDKIGKYFKFNATEWKKCFGSFSNGLTVEIKQCRGDETVYAGKVVVWDNEQCQGYCGRRDPYSSISHEDWQSNDYIIKPEDGCGNFDNTFDNIQFPLGYNFPQDDETGFVDRSFQQEGFKRSSAAKLTNKIFSLVDPETNMALSVRDCDSFTGFGNHVDIGSNSKGSSTVSNGNIFEVKGAGLDIWGGGDSFHFLYNSASGDVSIEVFVNSFIGDSLHSWAKGGLMLRDSLDENSKHFSLFVTGSNGLANQWRTTDGGLSRNENDSSLPNSSMWLKITKTENVLQAYYRKSDSLGVPADGSWRHPYGDPEGEYFKFNGTEWEKCFGSFTSGQAVSIKQCRSGKAIYTGEIMVWNNEACDGYCGRRNPGSSSAAGDWQSNDYIVKPEDNCYPDWLSFGSPQTMNFTDSFYYGIAVTSTSSDISNIATLKSYMKTSAGLKSTPHNEALSSQQFKMTADDQLESISCPGKVLSVNAQRTSWMCKKGDEEIGLITVDGLLKPPDSECNSKSRCSGGGCTIDSPPIHDYCVNGNELLLESSSPDDISQKWRFYDNAIMNVACKREPLYEGLVISQINDDFQDLSLIQKLELSFVNDGMAISAGEVDLTGGIISYKVTIQEYSGESSQLFEYRKAGEDDEGNDIFNIASVQYPDKLLTLSDCIESATVLLDTSESVNKNWSITGKYIVNLCEPSGGKKGSLSIDMTGASPGVSIQASTKNDEAGQKWTVKSNDVVLSSWSYGEENANQMWNPHFIDAGYDLGLHPGFPGTIDTCDGKECPSSAKDRHLAKEAMRICDKSMSFLLGGQLSVGTLKEIVKSIEEDGPGRMPGYCCMDNALNSEFFGYNFDPKIKMTDESMECQNKGPWHLGISDEACENAGGKWFRSPCLTLKDTIDNRPSRFDLQNPIDGTCQDNLNRLETAVVSTSMYHKDFPFEVTLDGCHEFCRSLPDYSMQVGMMTSGVNVISVPADGSWSHPNGDPEGEYFKFNATEWEKCFGSFTSGQAVSIKQCRSGKAIYTGEIMVWNNTQCDGYCGRRNPGSSSAAGDWQSNDYIVKPEDDCGKMYYSDCTCVYRNGKLPSRESMPSYSKPSPPKFTLTNSDGIALGLRPNVGCDASEDLIIEAQLGDPQNPRQQFQITRDRKIVSVRCPEKVLTVVPGADGTICNVGGGLQILEYGHIPSALSSPTLSPSSIPISSPTGSLLTEADIGPVEIAGRSTVIWSEILGMDADGAVHEPQYTGDVSDLQRWALNDNDFGMITNVGCPNLAISSSKKKDVSLNSIYFALQNPRTQLAIGTSTETCTDGMTLTMQDLEYGSPNQQFIFIEEDKKIVSLMCPEFSITVPTADCDAADGLILSLENNTDDRNKWLFNDNDVIQSVKCPDKYVTIHGASSGGARLVTTSKQFLKESPDDTSFGGPPEQNATTNSPTSSYNEKAREVETEWDQAKPPSVGSKVILSNISAERYQKWTKQRQLFHPLMGPFSVVNPSSGHALAVPDGICANGMDLSSTIDHHTSTTQQFYLGHHGSIFSAQCPGLVLAADNSTDSFFVRLKIFSINNKDLKWKFTNGTIESVSNSGMVLANNPDNIMIIKSNSTASDSNTKWIRMNTRLLASVNETSEWKQEWKVSFVDSTYEGPPLSEFLQDDMALNPKCYNVSSAFSASFDDFAKELVVNDAADEDQYRKVRQTLGFDRDHPFDVEVRDNFHQHQCDSFFTGVDHTSGNDMEALSAPPKFETVDYEPVEYEAVEYEEVGYVTIDYEEFSKGDDLGDLTETTWPDAYVPELNKGNLTVIYELDSAEAIDRESLVRLQRHRLNLGHALVVAQHVYDFATGLMDKICEALGEVTQCIGASLGLVCAPNPPKIICNYVRVAAQYILYAVLVGVTIAHQAVDDAYEIATMSDKEAYYGQYYSRATYINTIGYNEKNWEALDAIRSNMKSQHNEMKRQLQERHKDIANHVGQDIADAQNTLGQAIVDAQNDVGQGIIDAQNDIGQAIVDAQNALGQDIADNSNYITEQHNVLSEWLHENLCIIYKAMDGTCDTAIGPLQEKQAYAPMRLHWPEGQPTLIERLDQFQTLLSLSTPEKSLHSEISDARTSKVQGKMDAVEEKVHAVEEKVDTLSNDIRGRVNTVEEKIDIVKNELTEVKDMMTEVKDMMTKLIGMMAN